MNLPPPPQKKGIDVKFKNKSYPVLLDPTIIPEVTVVSVRHTGVTFGSSVTLSDIEETLREQVNTQPGQLVSQVKF